MSRNTLPTAPTCAGELQQYVEDVIVVSSEYGPSIAYSSVHLRGRPSNFPSYGDHTSSYLLPSYGPWRRLAPSYTPEFGLENVTPEDNAPVDDFVVVKFERSVYPTRIGVYETFNIGAVQRIWAYMDEGAGWCLLWDKRYDDELSSEHASNASRLFFPVIRTVRRRTRVLRLEFNTRTLSYISGIDGILLVGPVFDLDETLRQFAVPTGTTRALVSPRPTEPPPNDALKITDLSYEMLYEVFSHLDLKSLRNVEHVCEWFAEVVADARLYRVVNLRPYWYQINAEILQWLRERCKGIAKLDLSWCGMFSAFSATDLFKFFMCHGATLTHLRLNSTSTLPALPFLLTYCTNLTELCAQNMRIDNGQFEPCSCHQLIKLDLSSAAISTETLINLLKKNPRLQHLNISNCELPNVNGIAETVGQHNRELRSLNLWKTRILSATGLTPLKRCTKLQELDLGYSNHEEIIEGGLGQLVEACPRLRRVVLAGFRVVQNNDLLTIAQHCRELQYLDLMGCIMVSGESVNAIFIGCPALRLLDLNYCAEIQPEWITEWEQQYPHVDIKYSEVCF